MKKNLLSLIITFLYLQATACTNFLITKGASTDGSTMISYNADSHTLYGELYYWAPATYPEGTMLDIYDWDSGKYHGKIKQALQTYNVVGNMNEFQVAIGETTFGGLGELHHQKDAIIDYGSLIYIALQRSKSAREAIKVMTELVAEYGYTSHGESFSIMDANEVWILEMIGKGKFDKGAVWVARLIPDGYICAHANQARIMKFPLDYKNGGISSLEIEKIYDPEVNTIYAADVISFAKKHGFYTGKDEDFSFSDVYAPVSFGGARFCESRVWSMFRQVNDDMDKYEDYAMGFNLTNRIPLFIKPDRKIGLKDMISFMGDHFEGTKMDFREDIGAGPFGLPYRWRGLTWKVDGQTYFNERSTSTQQTGFTFIAQGRDQYPNPVGGILWFGVDDAYFTVYNPIFCGIRDVPVYYRQGYGNMMQFEENAAFWVFNQVSNLAYTRYNTIGPIVKEEQSMLEDKFIKSIGPISEAATKLFEIDKNLGLEYITDYSVNQADNIVQYWKKLYRFLFVKFMDGNIKKTDGRKFIDNGTGKNIPAYPDQPGYGEKTYRKIIEETGDRYKMR